MDLKEEILREHSKRQALKIMAWVGSDEKRFEALLGYFLQNTPIISQRAAYALGIIVDKYPELVIPHLDVLIENLKTPHLHDAIKRTTVRLLQDVYIPDDLLGTVTDICFNYLLSATEAIATKAFSMTVLLNATRRYPELKNELMLVIETQLPHGSAGIKHRGNKVLKELEKL